jgi:hypothetical protein
LWNYLTFIEFLDQIDALVFNGTGEAIEPVLAPMWFRYLTALQRNRGQSVFEPGFEHLCPFQKTTIDIGDSDDICMDFGDQMNVGSDIHPEIRELEPPQIPYGPSLPIIIQGLQVPCGVDYIASEEPKGKPWKCTAIGCDSAYGSKDSCNRHILKHKPRVECPFGKSCYRGDGFYRWDKFHEHVSLKHQGITLENDPTMHAVYSNYLRRGTSARNVKLGNKKGITQQTIDGAAPRKTDQRQRCEEKQKKRALEKELQTGCAPRSKRGRGRPCKADEVHDEQLVEERYNIYQVRGSYANVFGSTQNQNHGQLHLGNY